MATPKKAILPKKTKEAKKPTSKITKPSSANKKDDKKIKKKTSNGTVAAVKAPNSSKSQKNREQNGAKSTKTLTPKSKQNGKRVKEEKEDATSYTFPMERVKRIIKAEDSDLRINYDAIFLVNKAAELFLEKFSGDAHKCCVKDRKKALAYKHISSVICKQKRYEFLSDFVPEKIKAGEALAKRKQLQEGTS